MGAGGNRVHGGKAWGRRMGKRGAGGSRMYIRRAWGCRIAYEGDRMHVLRIEKRTVSC